MTDASESTDSQAQATAKDGSLSITEEGSDDTDGVVLPSGIDTETRLLIKKAIQLGRAKDEGEVRELKERYDRLEEEAHELDLREQILWATGECIDMYDAKVRLEEESRRRAKENAMRAQEIQRMEEQTFIRNAIDLYTMLQGNCFVVRQIEGGECSFLISTHMQGVHGEMLTHWHDERLVVRPANHGEYNVSVPASVLCKRNLESRTRMNHVHANSRNFPTLSGSSKEFDFGPMISKLKSNGRFERTPITREIKDIVSGKKQPGTETAERFTPPTPRRGRAGASY